jgi:Flp pilus assembly protein TadG
MKSERGVAAVEFALVVPWFLALLAIMITLGIGFWNEFVMLNIASATTRTCALTQTTTSGTDSSAQLVSCAQSTGNSFIGHYSGLCFGNKLTVDTVTTTDLPSAVVAGSTSRVHFLQYTLRCNMPLMFFAPPGFSPSVPLVARSTMPFLN